MDHGSERVEGLRPQKGHVLDKMCDSLDDWAAGASLTVVATRVLWLGTVTPSPCPPTTPIMPSCSWRKMSTTKKL